VCVGGGVWVCGCVVCVVSVCVREKRERGKEVDQVSSLQSLIHSMHTYVVTGRYGDPPQKSKWPFH